MAVRIRLTRVGATKRPAYRVVAIDKRRSRDGRALEILGYYDPLTEPATVQLQTERISAWIGKGAQPSDTVVRLMQQAEKAAASPASAEKPRRARSKGISDKPSGPRAARRAKTAEAPAAAATATAAETASDEERPAADAAEAETGSDDAADVAAEATSDSTAEAAAESGSDNVVEAATDSAAEPTPAEPAGEPGATAETVERES